jgi:hypothetical protein
MRMVLKTLQRTRPSHVIRGRPTVCRQPRRSRGGRPPAWLGGCLCLGLLLFSVAGCCTSRQMQPVNLSEPGWRVREGQGLWQPSAHRPEVAGELLVALHADGRCFLQFAKTPYPVVSAQTGPEHWQIEFPPQKMAFAGGGLPPGRFGWLHLCRALAGEKLPREWSFQASPEGNWRLENARTGETLKGYLTP